MSLRAEYSHAFVFNEATRKWEVTVFHHQRKKARKVGEDSVNFGNEILACANRLISAHMEKVTRMLDTPAEPSEEADQLANRGDQQQQEDEDQS